MILKIRMEGKNETCSLKLSSCNKNQCVLMFKFDCLRLTDRHSNSDNASLVDSKEIEELCQTLQRKLGKVVWLDRSCLGYHNQ